MSKPNILAALFVLCWAVTGCHEVTPDYRPQLTACQISEHRLYQELRECERTARLSEQAGPAADVDALTRRIDEETR